MNRTIHSRPTLSMFRDAGLLLLLLVLGLCFRVEPADADHRPRTPAPGTAQAAAAEPSPAVETAAAIAPGTLRRMVFEIETRDGLPVLVLSRRAS